MYCVGIHPDDTAYDWEIDATSGTEQSTVAVINNQTPAVAAEYQSNTRATVAARQSANPSTPQVCKVLLYSVPNIHKICLR